MEQLNKLMEHTTSSPTLEFSMMKACIPNQGPCATPHPSVSSRGTALSRLNVYTQPVTSRSI